MLSDTQYIENRVYEDDTFMEEAAAAKEREARALAALEAAEAAGVKPDTLAGAVESVSGPGANDAESSEEEARLMAKFKAAVAFGTKAVEAVMHETEDDYKYIRRPLPWIIGTPEWLEDPNAGLTYGNDEWEEYSELDEDFLDNDRPPPPDGASDVFGASFSSFVWFWLLFFLVGVFCCVSG